MGAIPAQWLPCEVPGSCGSNYASSEFVSAADLEQPLLLSSLPAASDEQLEFCPVLQDALMSLFPAIDKYSGPAASNKLKPWLPWLHNTTWSTPAQCLEIIETSKVDWKSQSL